LDLGIRARSTGRRALKGRALGLVLGTVGKGVLEKASRNTIKAIEERNGTHRAAAAK
jgi:hypothetical protein